MVHSNGTRLELQRFKIERTGSRKYSGRSSERRLVSAAGEIDARRAMPTSGAVAVAARRGPAVAGAVTKPASPAASGGQPAEGRCELLLGFTSGASSRTNVFGLTASGQMGKSGAGVGDAWRRRIRKPAAGKECTGDIAHLEQGHGFAFCSLCQQLNSLLIRHRPAPFGCRGGWAFLGGTGTPACVVVCSCGTCDTGGREGRSRGVASTAHRQEWPVLVRLVIDLGHLP